MNRGKPMALIKQGGANCTDTYNHIFSAAFQQCATGSSKKTEPHFVRDLISESTVQALNAASPRLYDEDVNAVSFRATFLHGSPLARFPAATQPPRVELADGMFVVYVTEPAGNGIHVVTRRAACLLMVKRSDDAVPHTFSYDPVNGPAPVGTDESQFYLFNRWPQFTLETGSVASPRVHGAYDVAIPPGGTGAATHDIGKFGVLWDHRTGATTWSTNTQSVHWLAGEPTPGCPVDPVHRSLGKVLEDFVDGAPGTGRDFKPAPSRAGGWDELMGTLLGYPIAGPTVPGTPPLTADSIMTNWGWGNGKPRDVNPLGLGFLAQHHAAIGLDMFEAADTVRGTIAQHARQLALGGIDDVPYLPWHTHASRFLDYKLTPPPDLIDLDGEPPPRRFPVLIATVNRFKPSDCPREIATLTLAQRARATRSAIEQAHRLLEFLR
jgi:hypothetical protein